MSADFLLFLAFVVVASLSGVLMPGPVFAVSIAKGHKSASAGAFIALGHGALEFPIMALVFFGMANALASPLAMTVIFFVGGAMLVHMGLNMLRSRKEISRGGADLPYGGFAAGFIATGSNAYFYLWWATTGALLILNASFFGTFGLLVFALVHWLTDLIWYLLVSMASYKSREIISEGKREALLGGCGLLLVLFGARFLASALGLG